MKSPHVLFPSISHFKKKNKAHSNRKSRFSFTAFPPLLKRDKKIKNSRQTKPMRAIFENGIEMSKALALFFTSGND